MRYNVHVTNWLLSVAISQSDLAAEERTGLEDTMFKMFPVTVHGTTLGCVIALLCVSSSFFVPFSAYFATNSAYR